MTMVKVIGVYIYMFTYYGGYKVKHIVQSYLWLKGIHEFLFIARQWDLGGYKYTTSFCELIH